MTNHVTITRVEGDAELTISWPIFASKDVVDDVMKRAISLAQPPVDPYEGAAKQWVKEIEDAHEAIDHFIGEREDAVDLDDRINDLGQLMKSHEHARKRAEDDGIALTKLIDAIEERARVGDVAAVLDLIHAHKNPPKVETDDDDVPF